MLRPTVIFTILGFVLGFTVGFFGHALMRSKPAADADVVPVDYNGDGTNDSFYYYSHGVPRKTQADRNFDGRMDYVDYYTNGVLSHAVSDDRFDVVPSTWVEFLFGQVAVVKQDTDSNGIPDIICYYSNSLPARTVFQPNGTGAVMKTLYYTNGILRLEVGDWVSTTSATKQVSYDLYGRPSAQP
jgi:hypothetical protein